MYTIEQSGKFKKDLKRYASDKEKLVALHTVIKLIRLGSHSELFK